MSDEPASKLKQYRKKPVVIVAYQTFVPLDIPTLEGMMHADARDWIITGIKGERYPCKPDIFAATYEAVEPPATPSALAVETAKEWIAYAGHRDAMVATEEFVESLSICLESAFALARAAERERCAKIAQSGVAGSGCGNVAADRIAAAIRKGGSDE